jgi:choline transport protein
MSSTKEEPAVVEYPVDDVQIVDKESDDGGIPARYRGTAADKRDMVVLGKKQVLRVCILDNCVSICYIVPN